MRRRRRVAIADRRRPLRQRPLAVDRLAHRVDDAAEPGRRRPHLAGGIGDHGAAAAPDAVEAGERHHHGVVAGKPITSQGMKRLPPVSITMRAPTDIAWIGPGDLDHQAAHADHPAINIDAVDVADLLGERLHCENLKFPRFGAAALNLVFTRIVNHCVTVFGD